MDTNTKYIIKKVEYFGDSIQFQMSPYTNLPKDADVSTGIKFTIKDIMEALKRSGDITQEDLFKSGLVGFQIILKEAAGRKDIYELSHFLLPVKFYKDLYRKTVSSLDGVNIKDGRAVGNTTRIVDNAIQQLFDGHKVILEDHIGMYGKMREKLSWRILSLVSERIVKEHDTSNLMLTHEYLEGVYVAKLDKIN